MSTGVAALSPMREQLTRRWAGLASRERQALTLVLLVVALFIVWVVFVQPAWRTVREAPAALDRLDVQQQELQRLAAEVRELRGAAPVSAAQASEALKAATSRLGDTGKLALRGDSAVLTLNGASAEGLQGWLNEARSAARARPVELQIQRAAQGYSGTLTVTLPGSP
jgi:general secretion pathway protein M